MMASALLLLSLLTSAAVRAAKRPIDGERSVMKVYADKSGLFSLFAHNHEILAPIASGTVDDSENPSVEFVVRAATMQVLDPKASAEERAKIQTTMLGPDVLDTERFPEIRFQSTSIEPAGDGRWVVRGNLILHGQTRPVTVRVAEKEGRYMGSATLQQSDFGIQPIRLFGGTVKVKDVVRIEFEILLAP